MKITFPCSRCGKTLKARENAVGQTRKCPVCATRVTCPRPAYDDDIVDAEIVDAEARGGGPSGRDRRRGEPLRRP